MRYRLLAPAGVAGAIALAAWVPSVTSAAAATPTLQPISAQALVAKAQASHVPGFSGTVQWSANLGLPNLSALTSGVGGQGGGHAFDPTSLLSGSHDISVWDGGPGQQRLALPGSLSEVDVVHNGTSLYYFDSTTQKVTVFTGLGPSAGRSAPSDATGTPLTPDQVAQKLLGNLDPSTAVNVVTPVYVAEQSAYQLVLTPRASQSTIGSVRIAVDAANGMPLRVQVFPRGSNAAALSLSFTKIDFSMPSASNFAAPHGSTTVTKSISRGSQVSGPPGMPGPTPSSVSSGHPTTVGSNWTTISVLNGVSPRVAQRLDQASQPAAAGVGRVVSSNLLNALLLPDGTVLAGFVTPSALEAAASALPSAG